MRTEFVFQHGWAFDANSWISWRKSDFVRGADVVVGERGYFGANKVQAAFSPKADRKVAIAHSFGAHLIPSGTLEQCDALVLINSFVSLKRNARAIRAMLKKFATSPDAVLIDFWANTYSPECGGMFILPPPGMNEVALEEDLARLADSELNLDLVRSIPQVVLLQSEYDRIVTAETRKELTEALPDATVIEVAGGSHAAHLTQAAKCLQLVEHWVTGNQSLTCRTQKL